MRQPQGPADVAAANQSLNSRLGGRRPAWMNADCNNTDDFTTPRRADMKRPRRSRRTTKTVPLDGTSTVPVPVAATPLLARAPRSLTAPHESPLNALPSPAQSDQPSPASATNPLNSPNSPRQAPVQSIDPQAPPQAMYIPLHNILPGQRLHNPANAGPDISAGSFNGSRAQWTPQNNTENLSRDASTTTYLNTSSGAQSHYLQTERSAEVPSLPVTSEGSTSCVQPTIGPNTPAQSPQSANMAVQPGPHSAKRKRFDIPFAAWARTIKNCVALLSRTPNPNTIDQRRLYLLECACSKQDYIFLQAHQVYCRWSCDPSMVYRAMPAFDKDTIDKAFKALGDMLVSNQHVSASALSFFLTFPVDILPTSQDALGPCLTRLASNWEAMTSLVMQRRRLPLVDEMIYVLGCDSPVLQSLIFVRARRCLQITDDGPHVQEMEDLFAQNQQAATLAYRSRLTLHMQHRTPSDWQLFESENKALVERYIHLVLISIAHAAVGRTRSQATASTPRSLPATTGSQPTTVPILTSQGPARSSWQRPILPSTMIQPNHVAVSANNQGSSSSTRTPVYSSGYGAVSLGNRAHEHVSQGGQQVMNSEALYPHHEAIQHYRQRNQQAHQHNGATSTVVQPSHAQWQHLQQPQLQGPVTSGTIASSPRPTQSSMIHLSQTIRPPNIHNTEFAPFFPPRLSAIPAREYARAPNDLNSFNTGLHQVNLRSPVRHVRSLGQSQNANEQKYFQFVRGFSVPPSDISPSRKAYEFSFNVDDMTLLSRGQVYPRNMLEIPLAEHFEGSVRLRLRCCRIKESARIPTETEWVTLATSWPRHIFITLSDDEGKTRKGVKPRRAPQNSKDVPAELTDMVSEGVNRLTVSVNHKHIDAGHRHALAVELIETRSLSRILADVYADQVIDSKATIEDIQHKAGWTRTEHDDDVQMEIKAEYTVDLTCPFSASIWETPVRGADCVHIQCFDLKTWLESRPRSPGRPHCQTHSYPCNCFSPNLSVVDHWKCPICNGDARPQSLRIDGFLAEVRRKLESEGNLRNTKALAVFPDNSWKPIKEDDEDEEDEIELEDRSGATNGTGTGASSSNASRPLLMHQGSRRPHYEVIDLLSDED